MVSLTLLRFHRPPPVACLRRMAQGLWIGRGRRDFFCVGPILWPVAVLRRDATQKLRFERLFCSVFVWVFRGARPIERKPVSRRLKTTGNDRTPRMDRHRIGRIEPACKFGPGGDYLSVWPPSRSIPGDPSSGHLTRLLESLAEIVGVLAGTRRIEASAVPPAADQVIARAKETTQDAVERHRPRRRFNPETAPGASSHRRFPGQPLLFADDCRPGDGAEPEPKHRIRASRRAAKKIAAHDFPGQGSLFEVDAPRAKSA